MGAKETICPCCGTEIGSSQTELKEVYTEYYALLRKRRLSSSDMARLSALKTKLRNKEVLGRGLRDELMYDVIDQLLAERERDPNPISKADLKQETITKVLESWKQAGLI